jgi:hypothetical protein
MPVRSLCYDLQLLRMPTPSLLIVPSRFKSGKLYSQIPTSGAGDFTVTRATSATRVNASGYIESVASGIPRLDYFASTGVVGCPALLVEPSGTNFARGVELLNTPNIATASGGITITTGSTDFLAPDGSSGTITKYVGGTASGSNFVEYAASTSVSASGVHTFSAFVKTGATNPLTFCALQFTAYTAASGTNTSYFNLASGTALTSGASIQDYGNGWYRIISAPYTIAADLVGSIRLVFAEGNNDASWPASGALNLTLYAWGIQLEAGSAATSYIPTTTGSVTRNADVVSVSGAVSGSIGQTEGTMYAEVDIQRAFLGTILTIDDGDTSDFISITKNANLTIRARIRRAGGTIVSIITSSAVSLGVHKIALGYTNGDYALYIDGISVGTSTNSTDYPATSLTQCVLSNANYGPLNDRIRAAALYTTRLTNDQLAALTTP